MIAKSPTANTTCVEIVDGVMIAFSDIQFLYMSHKCFANFGKSIPARTSFVNSCILQYCRQKNLLPLIEANLLPKGVSRNRNLQFARFTCLGDVRSLNVLSFILYLNLLAVDILSNVSQLFFDLI